MLPKNGEPELCSPRNESKNYASLGMGNSRAMVPRNRPRSKGWQKSWAHGVLDPILNYGQHGKTQVQTEEHSLNQAEQNKSRQ